MRSAYNKTTEIPKGLGAKHEAEGVLEILREFEVVELLRRDGLLLHVRGVDMLDGTPILDIKPYLSSIPEEVLRRGWLAEAEARQSE